MIKNIQKKKEEILEIIQDKIHIIDEKYRSGKSLDRYKIVLKNRKQEKNIKKYLSNDSYLFDIYKTLEAWDMNKRGAKLRKLSEIKQSLMKNIDYFLEIEKIGTDIVKINLDRIKPILQKLYNEIHLMESNARLVSFSKTLHFIFPNLFMPMDRQNTLSYFYSNPNDESFNKYFEIFSFCYDISREDINWNKIIEKKEWNTTIPKIIDNAIILRMLDFTQRDGIKKHFLEKL
jgi:hypothetical protein